MIKIYSYKTHYKAPRSHQNYIWIHYKHFKPYRCQCKYATEKSTVNDKNTDEYKKRLRESEEAIKSRRA